ncbi:alpha/beta fold hydrolase [Telluria aromaticivorans]|uniref:Alpha/beta hydrolase n=1 Tax=Telluria aromaticivorans TaxID=2725995 RepID=A0A7Y2JV68_9BURK|nr:alpha/beta hydrolase [Telluria aromaticivorans]NNG21622.1 hypothetical protein [Telluria aromaticivorans]
MHTTARITASFAAFALAVSFVQPSRAADVAYRQVEVEGVRIAYPEWQAWLRKQQLPTLVMWGKHDQAFVTPGGLAFKRDNPRAEVHILDGGHFVMDTRLQEVATITADFMGSQRAVQVAKP